MENWKNKLVTVIFAVIAGIASYAQEDSTAIVKTENKEAAYKEFKSIRRDSEMLNFLKANDSECYEMFHSGVMQKRYGKKFLISWGAATGAGVLVLASWGVISMFHYTFLIATLGISSHTAFYNWWEENSHWVAKTGLAILIAAQPLLITSITLNISGKSLKSEAKNNYANKYLKGNTAMLNFNIYPNGLGVSLKF